MSADVLGFKAQLGYVPEEPFLYSYLTGPEYLLLVGRAPFGTVAVGLIAALEWDTLAFDRRDAMVLGPLPVPGRTIVAAKLAALGTLLFLASSGITAVAFSLVAAAHQPLTVMVRLFAAHVITTMSASAFVFCSLVTVRALLGVLARGQVVLGTLIQFAAMTGLLCFVVFVPASLQLQWHQMPHHPRQLVGVRMPPIPPWMPTRWFVALYDLIRGAPHQGSAFEPIAALTLTIRSIAAAVVSVRWGYRHQLRAALGAIVTLIELTWRGSEFTGLTHPSIALTRAPLLLAFWLAIGLRASFFVPSELAAWTYRTNATERVTATHAALRGSLAALLVPTSATVAFLLTVPAAGWHGALRQAAFVSLAVLLLVELVAVTIPFVPFTRPYQPGHAKLKTRWPWYLVGVYLFGHVLVRIEQGCWADPGAFATLLLCLATSAAAADVVGGVRARRRPAVPLEDAAADEGRIAVLDLAVIGRPRLDG
jgi:hypothetical protein